MPKGKDRRPKRIQKQKNCALKLRGAAPGHHSRHTAQMLATPFLFQSRQHRTEARADRPRRAEGAGQNLALPRWRVSVPGRTGSKHRVIGRFCLRLSPSPERGRGCSLLAWNSLFPLLSADGPGFHHGHLERRAFVPQSPPHERPWTAGERGFPQHPCADSMVWRTARQKLISPLIDNSLKKGIRVPGFGIWAMETHLASEFFFFFLSCYNNTRYNVTS